MKVKRFVAASMPEAVSLVRSYFGQDAVILHTKKTRRRGIFGLFGKSAVEVIAAADGGRNRKSAAQPVQGRISSGAGSEAAAPAPAGGQMTPASALGPAASGAPVPSARPGSVGAGSTGNGSVGGAAAPEALAGAAPDWEDLRRELAEIRRALTEPRAGFQPPAAAEVSEPEPIGRLRRLLLQQDVAEEFVEELIAGLGASDAEDDGSADEAGIWQRARRLIAESVHCSSDPWARREGGARIMPLVGPTGVGKTTTLAKLAANYAFLQGASVALVTLDTYRVAAVEQLRSYAEIIGVPVEVAYTPEEAKERVMKHRDMDVVLVDTAGRSQHHRMRMAELRAFLDMLEGAEPYLVVSAATRTQDLESIHEQFSPLSLAGLIVTKLDETQVYGGVYTLVRRCKTPLAFLTNGQNVPDDLEVAEPGRIADLILGDQR